MHEMPNPLALSAFCLHRSRKDAEVEDNTIVPVMGALSLFRRVSEESLDPVLYDAVQNDSICRAFRIEEFGLK